MENIVGIKVELEVQSEWWAPSKDALFLGVYSSNGGREFRLKTESNAQTQSPKEKIVLTLGDSCCKSGEEIPVIGANDFNHPLLNPISLRSIEHPTKRDDAALFVYLRKETADSTSTNDDWLVLNKAKVLLCDKNGDLRQFQKQKNINFSDESGLQHWLTEVEPPRCLITVTLTHVTGVKSSGYKRNAGRKWNLNFGAEINGSTNDHNMLNDHNHQVSSNLADDWTTGSVYSQKSVTIIGCCGGSHLINIKGKASEKDPTEIDTATDNAQHTINCNSNFEEQEHQLTFSVIDNRRRATDITFHYKITAVCLT